MVFYSIEILDIFVVHVFSENKMNRAVVSKQSLRFKNGKQSNNIRLSLK